MEKDLVMYIVKNLVDYPQDVSVTAVEGEGSLALELRVAPGDIGKVIGRQGRIAKSIRTLLLATSLREGRRATLEILD